MKNSDLESLNMKLTQKIDSHIDNGLNAADALSNSLSSISSNFKDLGLSDEIINSIKTSSSSKFEEFLENGYSVEESIKKVLENIKETLENQNISENKEDSTDYNLNFLDPLNSEGAKLIDEGIKQGLSVEDAIKNANLKLFPDHNVQGPQTLSELKDIKSVEKQTAKSSEENQDNKELNIIEADMDAQEANNIAENEYDEVGSSEDLEQVNDSNTPEDSNKDDEIS
tara:strand:+ start:7007 stop:7687 length:681 start_codon:yes stop_codon:yes gene_type:complete